MSQQQILMLREWYAKLNKQQKEALIYDKYTKAWKEYSGRFLKSDLEEHADEIFENFRYTKDYNDFQTNFQPRKKPLLEQVDNKTKENTLMQFLLNAPLVALMEVMPTATLDDLLNAVRFNAVRFSVPSEVDRRTVQQRTVPIGGTSATNRPTVNDIPVARILIHGHTQKFENGHYLKKNITDWAESDWPDKPKKYFTADIIDSEADYKIDAFKPKYFYMRFSTLWLPDLSGEWYTVQQSGTLSDIADKLAKLITRAQLILLPGGTMYVSKFMYDPANELAEEVANKVVTDYNDWVEPDYAIVPDIHSVPILRLQKKQRSIWRDYDNDKDKGLNLTLYNALALHPFPHTY